MQGEEDAVIHTQSGRGRTVRRGRLRIGRVPFRLNYRQQRQGTAMVAVVLAGRLVLIVVAGGRFPSHRRIKPGRRMVHGSQRHRENEQAQHPQGQQTA